jgi:hypothetical protein
MAVMAPLVWYGILLLFVPSAVVQVVVVVHAAAVETVDLILEPSETDIQFFQYTLHSPGTIDLSGLQFTTDDTMFPIDSNSEDSMVSTILSYPQRDKGVGVALYYCIFLAFLLFYQWQSHFFSSEKHNRLTLLSFGWTIRVTTWRQGVAKIGTTLQESVPFIRPKVGQPHIGVVPKRSTIWDSAAILVVVSKIK